MTKREALNAIVNGTVNDEIMAWAAAEIEHMDNALEKRRNTPSKTALENAPLIARIREEILGAEPMTATEVGAALGVSTQKASALLRKVVAEGAAVTSEVKVKGKGTVKGYALA